MTSEFVALKKVKKSLILELNKVESVRTEREVLKETISPWLIRLNCSFQDDKHLFLAMVSFPVLLAHLCKQYAPGGNLKTLLENVVPPENQAKFYIAEMISAVSDLHNLGFVHRFFFIFFFIW